MALDESKVAAIVDAVLARLKAEGQGGKSPGAPAIVRHDTGKHGIFETIDQAVAAARTAFEHVSCMGLEVREKGIENIRRACVARTEELARMAVSETGLGRVEDKIRKNVLAATKTPGPEILVPRAFTGDHGLTLTERAPYGVICSITPCTNATETVINNVIGMVAGGNGVVINGHPTAKGVIAHTVRLLNEAMVAAGLPDNLVSTIVEPTIESAGTVMKHPGTALVVVTGGPAVVKAAMATGKKCIAAGPGNPPAIVDETAILPRAAKDIIAGASLDNNIVCIVEKNIVAVDAIADKLKQEMIRAGAYYLKDSQAARVAKAVIDGDHPNKKFVGKNVGFILREAGTGIDVPDECRIAFMEVEESHPMVQVEQLLPVLPFVRVRNVDDAIQAGLRIEHGYRHTAVMHSLNISNLHRYAAAANTSIFVKNGPSFAGLAMTGEGYTSWTIASPTGEGLTTAINYTRERRCVLKDYFRIV
ncbi:MAG: aldehyde dehydrogenase EutE [Deltaproteobacteria bacterium]|nr:aldehyde dehydrogenase EutE [Deltaproteobacteria bacterium]